MLRLLIMAFSVYSNFGLINLNLTHNVTHYGSVTLVKLNQFVLFPVWAELIK